MLYLTVAGALGRDAEFKTTQGGKELCSFSVAANTGYGDNKTTTWVDVTRWGAGAEGLARILKKGSKVAAIGQLSVRESNGKTYLQVRADDVTIQGTPDGPRREPDGSQGHADTERQSFADDLADDIPFIRADDLRF